jgi:hypothetical protein
MLARIVRVIARKIAAGCLLALCAGVVVDCAGYAQPPATGRIIGLVSDISGGVPPGVTLTLTGEGVIRKTVADGDGRFAFDALPADASYTVQAILEGFRQATQERLFVQPGETTTTGFALRVGCVEESQSVVEAPLDQLLKVDAVLHVRIVADSHVVVIPTYNCDIRSHQTSATIVGVGAISRGEWEPGATVQIASNEPLKAGTEYLAFLKYSDVVQRFTLGWYFAPKVIDGRVGWSPQEELGFRDKAPIGYALARIRETYARHTRYKRHGEEGDEAPLEALRYNTGWFEMGALRRDEDVWLDYGPPGVKVIPRPFDFVADPQSSRQLPRRGDRIRLHKGGSITIMDFGLRGEALRTRRPGTWNTESYMVTLTGTRAIAGGIYTVADITMWAFEQDRFISVRLVAD